MKKRKNKEPELNMSRTTPYKCKVRKLEFSKHETVSSSEELAKHNTEKYKDSSESNDSNQQKKNINRMKILLVSLKRSNIICSIKKLKREKKLKLGYLR